MRAAMMLAAVLGTGAAPRALHTAAQEKELVERNRLLEAVDKASDAGKPREALALLKQIEAIDSRVLGPLHFASVSTFSDLAHFHRMLGEQAEEEACLRLVVDGWSRLRGPGNHRTVDARLALAEALARMRRTPEQQAMLRRREALQRRANELHGKGQAARAASLLMQVLAIDKAVRGDKNNLDAVNLANIAGVLQRTGERAAALHLFKKAVASAEAAVGKAHPDYARSLSNLAWFFADAGRHGAAIPLMEESLAVLIKAFGEWHPACAQPLMNLAAFHRGLGDHKAALHRLRKAEGIYREAFGEKHPRYPACLNDLAAALAELGDRTAAMPLSRKALALTKELLGNRHPDYATCLSNHADLLEGMGAFKAALAVRTEALAVCEALDRRHPRCAASMGSLAGLLDRLGNHKEAGPLYDKALAILMASLGERHPDTVAAMRKAALYRDDSSDALALLEKAARISQELWGEGDIRHARCLRDLGLVTMTAGDMKRVEAARDKARAAIRAASNASAPPSAELLDVLADVSEVLLLRGETLPLLKKALVAKRAVYGERHPDLAFLLNSTSFALRRAGDRDAARRHSDEALAIMTDHLRESSGVLSDRQQLAVAETFRWFLDNRLVHSEAEGGQAAAGHVLAWKGALLLRQQQRRLFLRLSADPAARRETQRLQAIASELAALRASPAPRRERLESLEKEQDDAQARLSGLSVAFREARGKDRASPTAVAAALPEGAVLVDYLFHGYKRGRSLLAFVHRRGKAVVRIDLGKAASVEEAVREWRPLLARGKESRAFGEKLKKLVYAPLEMHLEGAKVVLVSPDGVLGMVPFAALPGKKEGTYVVEDVALAVVPVPQMLPEMLLPVDRKDRLPPSLLVTGDLRYDPEDGAEAPLAVEDHRSPPRSGRERFGKLEATRAELLAVKASFSELFRAGTVVDLRGGEATKSAVRKALAGVRYAHFATHGFFAPETVASSLADGKDGRGRREGSGWHPLLLSGLALSDANRVPKPGEEDGILTALEVSETDLTRLELAVLSACETGLGKVADGEGILGMQRAFAAAGARSVVASLWKVDDAATQRLMADFYAAAWNTKKIVSRAEALRHAQLTMLREGRRRGMLRRDDEDMGDRLPPYYWAAFVLSGDWR